jgi:alkanesulfonate monooxygenase SsuD/methylene tetrahydromethanopterin reductase-like flavin-dependent oxidoreductase (luciferase family)
MAEHAEMANFTAGFDEIPRKLEVLAGHCERAGRDMATINKTPLASLFLGRTHEEGVAKLDQRLAALGMKWGDMDEAGRKALGARFLIGDADEVGEQVRDLFALGLDGVVTNMPSDGADLEAVAFAGEVLAKASA